MSDDDVAAEEGHAAQAQAITGLLPRRDDPCWRSVLERPNVAAALVARTTSAPVPAPSASWATGCG